MKRHATWAALAAGLGLALPIFTLAFGWGYASIRETRLKEAIYDERMRSAVLTHFRWEMAGLFGLVVLAFASGYLAITVFRRSEELARERAKFVTAVSHELRTPLATLRLHAEMLTEGLVGESRKARVYTELRTETERLTRLIENVLEASRIAEGRQPRRLSEADLRAAVRQVLATMECTVRTRGFTVQLEEGEPVIALFDPAALSIILHNVVDNALKYAAGHDPRVIEISIKSHADAAVRTNANRTLAAVLRVRDHGPGVPPRERERVFDRFYRVKDEALAHRPGTGLGLALVRELATAHGGYARIPETRGAGTTIEVAFPGGQEGEEDRPRHARSPRR